MSIAKNVLITVLIAFMLLTPVVNIPGALMFKSLDLYSTGFLIFFTIHSVVASGRLKYMSILSLVYTGIVILLSLMIFQGLLNNHSDMKGVQAISRSGITFIAAYGCSQLLNARFKEKALMNFIKIVILCALLQGTVFWFSFLVPDIRNFMSLLFYRDFSLGTDHLVLLRVPGFVPTGGDGLSMNQALLTTVGLAGSYLYFSKWRYFKIVVIALCLSIISIAFTGRSGLYLGIFFALVIFASRKSNFQLNNVGRFFLYVIILFSPLMLLGEIIGDYGWTLYYKFGYEYPLVRLLRGFMNINTEGSYSDATISTLLGSMLFIPDEPLRFLFGNNDFTSFGQNKSTDIGYIRMWHGFGILGLICFLLSFFVIPIYQLYKSKHLTLQKNLFKKEIVVAQFQIVLFVLFFGLIGHFKIFFLTTRIFFFVFFVLLFLVLNNYRRLRFSVSSVR